MEKQAMRDAGWYGKGVNGRRGATVGDEAWGEGQKTLVLEQEDEVRKIWLVKDGRVIEHECRARVGFHAAVAKKGGKWRVRAKKSR